MKIFKKFLFVFFIALLGSAIIKNSFFDTPTKIFKKFSKQINELNQESITANLYSKERVLTYKIYYMSLIPMGTLKLSTLPGKDETNFSIFASTKDSYLDDFVNASIEINSHFNNKTLLPYLFNETTLVRGKKKFKEIEFDRRELVASIGDRKIKIYKDTYDCLGVFINMIGMPFELNKSRTSNLLSKDEIYNLTAEPIKFLDETAQLIVSIDREEFNSLHGARFYVWITNGSSRIPLLFKSWTPVGYVSVVLNSIEIKED